MWEASLPRKNAIRYRSIIFVLQIKHYQKIGMHNFFGPKKFFVHSLSLFHMQGASHVLSVIHEILAHHRLVRFYYY